MGPCKKKKKRTAETTCKLKLSSRLAVKSKSKSAFVFKTVCQEMYFKAKTFKLKVEINCLTNEWISIIM